MNESDAASNKASAVRTGVSWPRAVALIAGREIGAYFDSSIAYVYTIAFVVLANSIFMNEFFLVGTADMTSFFTNMPLLLAFFVPAITMRLWAEERKTRTIELLLTLPIQTAQAVLGKFVAAVALFGLFLLGSLPIPVMLIVLGEPDIGQVVSGYLGLTLLGAMFIALGMLFSAVTTDQIVAFAAAMIVAFAFVLTGHERVVPVVDGIWPALGLGTLLYERFSVVPHYESFVRGVIELGSVLYFVLFSAAFLWLNTHLLQRMRT